MIASTQKERRHLRRVVKAGIAAYRMSGYKDLADAGKLILRGIHAHDETCISLARYRATRQRAK